MVNQVVKTINPSKNKIFWFLMMAWDGSTIGNNLPNFWISFGDLSKGQHIPEVINEIKKNRIIISEHSIIFLLRKAVKIPKKLPIMLSKKRKVKKFQLARFVTPKIVVIVKRTCRVLKIIAMKTWARKYSKIFIPDSNIRRSETFWISWRICMAAKLLPKPNKVLKWYKINLKILAGKFKKITKNKPKEYFRSFLDLQRILHQISTAF